MRVVVVAWAALPGVGHAEPAVDPLATALDWLADPAPEVHGRAFDVLVRRAPPERVTGGAGGADLEARLHGVRYLIGLAERLRATSPTSAERFLWLEEAFGSAWSGHVPPMLQRAGLSASEIQALLLARMQARGAFRAFLERAMEGAGAGADAALVEARKAGPALLPHLLQPLAVPPWLASQGWPGGPFVIQQRCCCWALKALKAPQAIPLLFLQLQSPSSLAWDALDTLHTLTGDPVFEASTGSLPSDAQVAHRDAWWATHGAPHRDAARWAAVEALRQAASWMVSRRGDPEHWMRSEAGGTPPDPFVRLYDDLHRLTGLGKGGLPAPAPELGATDVPAWLPRLLRDLRALEAR